MLNMSRTEYWYDFYYTPTKAPDASNFLAFHAFMIKFADLIFSFGDNLNIRFTVMIIQCSEEVGITNYKHLINALMIILSSNNSIMAIGSP